MAQDKDIQGGGKHDAVPPKERGSDPGKEQVEPKADDRLQEKELERLRRESAAKRAE